MSVLTVEESGSPRWAEWWAATGREPFAHQAFGELLSGPDDRVVAICWEDDGGRALLPLTVRDLPAGVVVDGSARDWVDATSPYGYGGPFTQGSPDVSAFFEDVLAWMRDARVLSCFVRGAVVGPDLPAEPPPGMRALHLADNVVVDLVADADERWRRYEHKVRKNVKKARRHDLSTAVSDRFVDVEVFAEIYGGTMDRRSATDFYRFDQAFFARLGTALAGSYWVADTHDADGVVVSTELVLTSDTTCYSFLGGTRREAFSMSPNDLLKHDVIDHAAAAGLSHYVLGGGYAPGDGIFRYKRAFDPTGVVPFHGIQLVGDAALYETASGGPAEDDGFFPRYRRPVPAPEDDEPSPT